MGLVNKIEFTIELNGYKFNKREVLCKSDNVLRGEVIRWGIRFR